ncbi:MAG: RNA polymerase sigma factor, partial [Planctomycetales bacterium]
GDRELLGKLLEECRADLQVRAESQLGELVGRRVGASDVVQQSFLQAFRAFVQFDGLSRPEFTAWLQRILEREIAQAVRKHVGAEKRSVSRDQSLHDSSESGVVNLELGHSREASPSRMAILGEDAAIILQQLKQLPPNQQTAVKLRYLEGRTLAEIAEQLDRSKVATAGLIKRGLQRLRNEMNRENETETP